MTIRHLKAARSLEARAEDDARTRAIVEAGLKEIETKGDAAVREMSVKFDNTTATATASARMKFRR